MKSPFEEIMAENFPYLVKEKDTQIQKAHGVPNKLDPKRPIQRHIIIKMTMLKEKEKTLKATKKSR